VHDLLYFNAQLQYKKMLVTTVPENLGNISLQAT